jgi:uncharacterized protein (TIGR02246 family)
MNVMTPAEVQSIIHSARDAWLTSNASQFANLFAENGVFIVPGKRWIGAAAICDAVSDYVAQNSVIRIDVDQILVDGDRAMVEWHWVDQNHDTGDIRHASDAIAIDFEHAKITRWREYIDSSSAS